MGVNTNITAFVWEAVNLILIAESIEELNSEFNSKVVAETSSIYWKSLAKKVLLGRVDQLLQIKGERSLSVNEVM